MDARQGGCWSGLPYDILDLVLQRLLLTDCFTFGEVCTSWRSAFLDRRRLSRPPPFLILKPYRDFPQCFGLDGRELRRLRSMPRELQTSENIIGSSKGWLVIATSRKSNLHLLNFRSNKRIWLPSIETEMSTIGYLALSSAPTSDDCLIVVKGCAHSGHICLMWCRPRNHMWTTITPPDPSGYIRQIMFHKGALHVRQLKGDILIYTFTPQPKLTSRVFFDNFGIRFNWIETSRMHRLVESDQELLLVIYGCLIDSSKRGWTYSMIVFKLDEEQDGQWERVESLGENVLLLGHEGAEYTSTQGLIGSSLEPNCIYEISCCSHTLEKYFLADGSCQEIPYQNYDNPTKYRPNIEWIVSQSW